MSLSNLALPGFQGVVIDTSGQRRPHDYYATPRWAVRAMMPYLLDRIAPGRGYILEPGCGHGAVAVPLADAGFKVLGVDIRPEAVAEVNGLGRSTLRAELCNLLIQDPIGMPRPLAAVGNPPFKHAQAFVERCLSMIAQQGLVCFLLPVSFLATTGRIEFWRRNPADLLVLDRRPDFTGGGGANAEYAWYQWPPRAARGQIFREGEFG